MRKNDPIQNIASKESVSVQVGQKLSEARHLMCNENVHHIPVLDGKKLVGMISFTDMMKINLMVSGTDERSIDAVIDSQFTISDIMTKELKTISEHGTVRDAAEVLSTESFHSLPIVNKEGDLTGIVTSTDLIRYLYEQY